MGLIVSQGHVPELLVQISPLWETKTFKQMIAKM